MFSKSMNIADFDPDLWAAMQDEEKRQEDHIELIASENYTSPRVMQAQGSVLTNKYAEGYPAKRYYGGCEYVDVVESIAIERAKQLFDCGFVNVQPHSGSQANQAVMLALIKPGATILGMDLASAVDLAEMRVGVQSLCFRGKCNDKRRRFAENFAVVQSDFQVWGRFL